MIIWQYFYFFIFQTDRIFLQEKVARIFYRNSHRRCFTGKGVLKNIVIFTKTSVLESLFNKVFFFNVAKFLRTPFFYSTLSVAASECKNHVLHDCLMYMKFSIDNFSIQITGNWILHDSFVNSSYRNTT